MTAHVPEQAQLAALVGDKYSPNLRKWLVRNRRTYWGVPNVFIDRDDARWIGWIDEQTWFVGCRLMRCLRVGAKAEVGCWTFPVSDLKLEPDFWSRYAAIGRCAIDEAHVFYFLGDSTRWQVDGDTRRCLWCGNHAQHLRRWTETVDCQRWERAA